MQRISLKPGKLAKINQNLVESVALDKKRILIRVDLTKIVTIDNYVGHTYLVSICSS